jgi:hypothetical protein
VQQGLAEVLTRSTQARLFDLMLRDGFGPSSPGRLTAEEARRFRDCLAALKAGKAVGPEAFHEVADPAARARIGRWLTNMSRSDLAGPPSSLAELRPILLITDPRTASHLRRLYDTYVTEVFGLKPSAVEGRVCDLRTDFAGTTWKRWMDFSGIIQASSLLVITFRPLEPEDACVIPNLARWWYQSHDIGMIQEENRSFVLLRGQFFALPFFHLPLDAPFQGSDVDDMEREIAQQRTPYKVKRFRLP